MNVFDPVFTDLPSFCRNLLQAGIALFLQSTLLLLLGLLAGRLVIERILCSLAPQCDDGVDAGRSPSRHERREAGKTTHGTDNQKVDRRIVWLHAEQ